MKHHLRLISACLFSVILMSACGGTAAPSATAPAAASPKTSAGAPSSGGALTKVTISYSNIVATELPVWAAMEGGIFKKHGLDVDLRLLESSQGLPALLAGEIQIADIAGSQLVSGAAAGADLVDFAEDSPVYPYVFQAPADIKTVNDLKGKKVGVSSVGSASDIATRVGLKRVGLDPNKDVTILAVGSTSARTTALLNGAIQGGLSVPPDTLILEDHGFHTLFDLAELKLPTSNATEVAQRSWVSSHRDVTQKYVDSLIDAIATIKKDKPFTVSVLKKYFKKDDERAMSAAYDYVVGKVIPALPYPNVNQLTDAKAVLAQKNEKVAAVDLNKLIDRSFVQNAADRGLGKS